MRLGHLNFDSMNMMAQKEMLKGLPSIEHPNQFVKDVKWTNYFIRAFQRSIYQKSQPL